MIFLKWMTAIWLMTSLTQGARILSVFPFSGKSHSIMINEIVSQLVSRGHQVTHITNFPLGKKLGENYTEILIQPIYDYWSDLQHHFMFKNIFEFADLTLHGFLTMLQILGEKTTEHALKQPKVRKILERNDTTDVYDLLLTEQFYQEAFLALTLKYNIPAVTVSTLGYENYMGQITGYIVPWSFVPHGFLPFSDKMTFWERLVNTFASLYEDLHREIVYFPLQDALVNKYFSHLPMKIPKVSQMEKNVSLILLNAHLPVITPRPRTPNLIEVGGMHISPPKALPKDIQKFLDEAVDGVIYFSLGSNLRSAEMPAEKLEMFFTVFENMKQRILWKFEDENVTGLPKNVMIKKWMPQTDILAHPNVKVFITHGGMFGTQEGVHYGVPMLGLPIYCDQRLNMQKAANGGYAITLRFEELTKETLESSLRDLIENPSYKQNVQKVSTVFRDRPLSPRETAMYWIEYVIRHKGAPQLRSAALDLSWYQLYLLDVIAFTIGSIAVIIAAIIWFVRSLFRKNSKKSEKSKTT